nr:hypothetical protein [uncultured Tolumonas sp.]
MHGLSIFTESDLNNRSELLADNIESTKFTETSTDLFSEQGEVAKKLRPDDEPLRRYTLTVLMVADT